jgi:hypothetical protein
LSIPDKSDPDFNSPEGSMLILTTIYFTDLKDVHQEGTQNSPALEPSAAKSRELFRELLSLYEGRNRVLPIDRKS